MRFSRRYSRHFFMARRFRDPMVCSCDHPDVFQENKKNRFSCCARGRDLLSAQRGHSQAYLPSGKAVQLRMDKRFCFQRRALQAVIFKNPRNSVVPIRPYGRVRCSDVCAVVFQKIQAGDPCNHCRFADRFQQDLRPRPLPDGRPLRDRHGTYCGNNLRSARKPDFRQDRTVLQKQKAG